MTTNYKVLGQAVNQLKIDAPENGSTIVSELKIKNTSYPTNVDIFVTDESEIIDNTTYLSAENSEYIIKNKELSYDDEVKISGGIALESGQSLVVETRQYSPDTVVIQAYGIEETA
jgi:hypothetical protein